MNDPIPIFIAILHLTKSSFGSFSCIKHAGAVGTTPNPLPLSHADDIITST